jgi:hypothetical protein
LTPEVSDHDTLACEDNADKAVPIPFSVFPSSYRNVSKDAVEESTTLKVRASV